jgi:putative MATE family efflux protein
MNRAEELGTGKIGSLLLKFSLPAIVGMVVNALYNVADRAFVGKGVGSLAIAGITVSFPVMLVLMGFGMLIGLGANSLISIRLGEKKKAEAEQILGNSIVLLIIVSVFLTASGLIFLKPLLDLFGASSSVLPFASSYLKIILIGSIFQHIGFGMNNFIRGEGNPKVAMFTMLIGGILNIILDPLFIFVFKWGIEGAAAATVISQMVSAIWVLSYYFSGKSLLKIHFKNFKLNWNVAKSIFVLGSAPFSMQIAASMVNTLLNKQLSYHGGDLALSAMGIVFSIGMLFLMPIFGINQGAQPIIGYNYGARQFNRVKKTHLLSSVAATVITTTGFFAAVFLPEVIIGFFNSGDNDLIELGSHAMRIFLSMFPIVGFQIVTSNYFQAVGKPHQAMLLSLSRQVLLLIPFLFVLPGIWGLNGVFASGPAADFGASLLAGTLFYFEMKSLQRKHDATE